MVCLEGFHVNISGVVKMREIARNLSRMSVGVKVAGIDLHTLNKRNQGS